MADPPEMLTSRLHAASHERCVIVCASFGESITAEQCFRVRDALNGLDTDGWWFWQPGNFVVVFRASRAGADRARACKDTFAHLARQTPAFPAFGIGTAEGDVLCGIASRGHLDTPPLGEVVNQAFRRAVVDAS